MSNISERLNNISAILTNSDTVSDAEKIDSKKTVQQGLVSVSNLSQLWMN